MSHRILFRQRIPTPPPPPPPPPSGIIQFTPGHWCNFDRGSGSGGTSGQLSFITSLGSQQYIAGLDWAGLWGELDNGTSGPNYTVGENLLDQFVNTAESIKKPIIVNISWSRFTTATPSGPLGCCPPWFQQGASTTNPSYILRPAGATWNGNLATSACYWYAPTMKAFVAMVAHFAARYANSVWFEGFRFSETASAADPSFGNTTSNALAQWIYLAQQARSAAPTKEISIAGNYLGADTDTLALIQACVSNRVIPISGPDSGSQRNYQFNQVYNGYNSTTLAKSGTDFRGLYVPQIFENQYPNEASGGNVAATTPASLYGWAQPNSGFDSKGGAINPGKYVWYQNGSTGPSTTNPAFNFYTWTNAILPFINSIQGACNQTRPSGY